jgi:hypothetical protein
MLEGKQKIKPIPKNILLKKRRMLGAGVRGVAKAT